MRPLALAAAATCLLVAGELSAGGSVSPQTALRIYKGRLAKQCPAKHLEMLAPAVLLDTVEDFTASLPAKKRQIVDASIKSSCRGVDMGATCDNVGFLQAAIDLGELDRFVAKVCALPQRCTDDSMCTEIK